MIVNLSNGNEVILKDVARNPKAEGIAWLREYIERKEGHREKQAQGSQAQNEEAGSPTELSATTPGLLEAGRIRG